MKQFMPSTILSSDKIENNIQPIIKAKLETEFENLNVHEIDLYSKILSHFLCEDRMLLNFLKYENDTFFEQQCVLQENENDEIQDIQQIQSNKILFRTMIQKMYITLWTSVRSSVEVDLIFQTNVFFDETQYEEHSICSEKNNEKFVEVESLDIESSWSDIFTFN